jgi:hypothetical protein
MAVSFFRTTAVELVSAVATVHPHDDAQREIFTCIGEFNNTPRLYWALGDRAPQQLEADAQKFRVLHGKPGVISLPPPFQPQT